MSPPPSLLDFPNELLLHVLDLFEDGKEALRATYTLTITCRRLHQLFLPRYLAHFHITDPAAYTELIFVDQAEHDAVDALSGMQVSLTTHIRDLICRFQLPRGEKEVDLVIMRLRRLHQFLCTLDSVGSVSLFFAEGESSECGCCLGFRQGETLDWILEQWSTTMGRTLSKVIEKGCQSLTVSGGIYMVHSYYYKKGRKAKEAAPDGAFAKIKTLFGKGKTREEVKEGPSLISRGPGELVNVLRGEKWEFDRATGTGTTVVLTRLSEAARKHSKLRALTLSSRMIFVPPLLHLLVLILRMPSLELLTISNVSMNKKFWPTVFHHLSQNAGPHLKHLHMFGLRRIVASDILTFVTSLPNLRTLHLGSDIQHLDHYDLGPFPDFPYLETLHAPALWVFSLLKAQRRGLQRLDTLEIVYNLRNDGLAHWIRRPKMLSLPMLLTGESHRPVTVSLHVHMGKDPSVQMLRDVEKEADAAEREVRKGDVAVIGGGPNSRVQGPDEMSLIFDDDVGQGLEDVFGDWIELFWGLKEMEIVTRPPNTMSDEEAWVLIEKVMENGGLTGLKNILVNDVSMDS